MAVIVAGLSINLLLASVPRLNCSALIAAMTGHALQLPDIVSEPRRRDLRDCRSDI